MLNTLIVWRKEIVDTMRDSRTVFLTLALPLFLYPIIFVIIGRVQEANVAHEERATLRVAVRGLADAPSLEAPLKALAQVAVVPVTLGPQCVAENLVELLIDVPEQHEARVLAGDPSTLHVYFDAADNFSRRASELVKPVLDEYRLSIVRRTLAGADLDPAVVDAPRYELTNLAGAGAMGAVAAAAMIPYLLVLLIASGASHTAIDTTAGEKERSTLETVLVSAASRTQIVLGKFLAVVSTSYLSGLMGFIGLALAVRVPTSIWRQAGIEMRVEPGSAIIILLMMVPVAALLSSVFLALGCFARGTREGQTFASYFIIFVIMLAVMSSMIEIELTNEVFMIPIVGTTLAQRQLLTGSGDLGQVLIAIASTLTVAAAALWLAVRLFADERVMFRR